MAAGGKRHSIRSFSEAHPAWTQSALRNLAFKAKENGLAEAGAIVHSGRKIIIVEEPFLEAIESGTAQRQQTAKRKQAA